MDEEPNVDASSGKEKFIYEAEVERNEKVMEKMVGKLDFENWPGQAQKDNRWFAARDVPVIIDETTGEIRLPDSKSEMEEVNGAITMVRSIVIDRKRNEQNIKGVANFGIAEIGLNDEKDVEEFNARRRRMGGEGEAARQNLRPKLAEDYRVKARLVLDETWARFDRKHWETKS